MVRKLPSGQLCGARSPPNAGPRTSGSWTTCETPARAKSSPAAGNSLGTAGVRIIVIHVPSCTSPRSARVR